MKPEWKVGDRCAVYSHAGRDVGTFDGPSPSGRDGIVVISTGLGLETKKIWAHHKQVRRLIKRPMREFWVQPNGCAYENEQWDGTGKAFPNQIRVREVRGKK